VLVGTAAITAMNLLRLCTLYYLGESWPAGFEYAHRELWPLLLIAFSLVIFVAWAQRSPAPGPTRHANR
jgi:exosortase/archaeosortase family protein